MKKKAAVMPACRGRRMLLAARLQRKAEAAGEVLTGGSRGERDQPGSVPQQGNGAEEEEVERKRRHRGRGEERR